jgi:hypothetical protein
MGGSGNDMGILEGPSSRAPLHGASAPSTTCTPRWSALTEWPNSRSHDSGVSGVELIACVVGGLAD